MRLGALIKEIEVLLELDEISGDANVYFDFGRFSPVEMISWRGVYSELAITYENHKSISVDDFLVTIKSAVGTVFDGWKGGEFRMDENTLVWVSNPGECNHTSVSGVCVSRDETLIINTFYSYN